MLCYEQAVGNSEMLQVLLSKAMEAKTSRKEVMLCEEISFCVKGETMTYGVGDVLKVAARVLEELKRSGKKVLVWA